MKTNHPPTICRRSGFTLIELLVVMAVIAILAAVLFPAFGIFKKSAAIKKATVELKKVAMAIESYKAELGHYPPDHAKPGGVDPLVNSLYFELSGTTIAAANFETLDGSARIPSLQVQSTFGQAGFVNCSRGGGDDNAQPAKAFVKGLPPTQYGELSPNVRLLVCSIQWPEVNGNVVGVPLLNPWRYVSSNPTNNPGSYDLWVDIVVGGKTNRISNWSEKPQIVAY